MRELLRLEQQAIERIKAFEPEEGYYLAFPGIAKAMAEQWG